MWSVSERNATPWKGPRPICPIIIIRYLTEQNQYHIGGRPPARIPRDGAPRGRHGVGHTRGAEAGRRAKVRSASVSLLTPHSAGGSLEVIHSWGWVTRTASPSDTVSACPNVQAVGPRVRIYLCSPRPALPPSPAGRAGPGAA
eukprot:6463086-Prymnesium_polylepis.1